MLLRTLYVVGALLIFFIIGLFAYKPERNPNITRAIASEEACDAARRAFMNASRADSYAHKKTSNSWMRTYADTVGTEHIKVGSGAVYPAR